jgi:hypothetical protein
MHEELGGGGFLGVGNYGNRKTMCNKSQDGK